MKAGHYDDLETRDSSAREGAQFAALPDVVARAMTAPGWARHLKGVDPKSITSRAALAKLPVLSKADLAARQGQAPADVARADLRAAGPGEGLRQLRARAVCRRVPRRRYRAQFVFLSSDAGRLHSRRGRGCAGLRRHSGRRRQYRAAVG